MFLSICLVQTQETLKQGHFWTLSPIFEHNLVQDHQEMLHTKCQVSEPSGPEEDFNTCIFLYEPQCFKPNKPNEYFLSISMVQTQETLEQDLFGP